MRRRLVALGPPAIVALLGVVTALSVRRERIETGWVMHTQSVRASLGTVFVGVRDAEAGIRGYLLTRDTATLLAYHTQLPIATQQLDTLSALLADNPQQSARLALLDTLVRTKAAELADVANVALGGRVDSAIAMVQANQKNRLVNRIRTLLATMDAEEAGILVRRLQNVERQRRLVVLIVVIGTVVAAALALLALQLLSRGARQLELQGMQLAKSRDELLASAEQLKARTLAAEEANRAKAQFLTTMSHELRTPLNAIDGYAELLEMGLRGPVTAAQAQDLSRIRRSQRHLLALVNDVLNFARLEAGRVEWQITDVSVDDTLQMVESLIRPQLEAKRISYTRDDCDDGLTVRADAEKLRQILVNLLGNAWKFTEAGGAVSIGCDCDDTTVRIRVRDTGRGIPAEKLPTIFDPFVQVDRQLGGDSQQGVGLGLAISRDLARGMNGNLDVTSTVGAGSEFVLSIPRAGVAAGPPQVTTQSPS
ncbi:MAG TPA: CHASE3 domain-containing protein [Gemmatimonadaceae bacterium]|nr:CHASE3 domain-containing protein [Gemmatimonadaceae bacterium]